MSEFPNAKNLARQQHKSTSRKNKSMSKKSIETFARLVVLSTMPLGFGRVTVVTLPIDLKDANAGLETKMMQRTMKRNEDCRFILT